MLPNMASTLDGGQARRKIDRLQRRLGLSDAELRKLVLRHPSVLGCSFEDNIEPKLAALQRRLGASDAELRKLAMRQPAVLGLSFEENIEPKLAALQRRLGL
eukprot:1091422-Prymnesium_polylepis.1